VSGDGRLRALLARWVRPAVAAMNAYHVPPAHNLVKLDAMENPWPWPGELEQAWLEALRGLELNRYPDPAATGLLPVLREAMAVPPEAEIILGNGSDELIQMILLAVAAPGRTVLAPEPTFVMYRMIATAAGMDCVGVPLRGDFGLDREAMLRAMAEHQPAVVFLARPNNPTGNLFAAADVEAVIDAAPGLVVVDEAYHVFAGETFMDRAGGPPNLLVMRTVSKMGLAGLRLGLLAGPPAWVETLHKVRLPYNINTLTQASAAFALEHRDVLLDQARAIRAQRTRLGQALAALPGVTAWPSEANFILFRVEGREAGAVFDGLRARGVLIKNLDGTHPLLAGCLRVTVGRPEENDAFLDALADVLRG